MALALTVPPFGGPNYKRNAERCSGDETPCACCGRPIKDQAKAVHAVVVDGGAAWGDENSDPQAPGYMGAFPVGADCARRYAAPAPATAPVPVLHRPKTDANPLQGQWRVELGDRTIGYVLDTWTHPRWRDGLGRPPRDKRYVPLYGHPFGSGLPLGRAASVQAAVEPLMRMDERQQRASALAAVCGGCGQAFADPKQFAGHARYDQRTGRLVAVCDVCERNRRRYSRDSRR